MPSRSGLSLCTNLQHAPSKVLKNSFDHPPDTPHIVPILGTSLARTPHYSSA